MNNIINILPTDVCKHVLFEYIGLQDLARTNDISILQLQKDRQLELLLYSIEYKSNLIASELIGKFINDTDVLNKCIEYDNVKILKMSNISANTRHLKKAVDSSSLGALKYLYNNIAATKSFIDNIRIVNQCLNYNYNCDSEVFKYLVDLYTSLSKHPMHQRTYRSHIKNLYKMLCLNKNINHIKFIITNPYIQAIIGNFSLNVAYVILNFDDHCVKDLLSLLHTHKLGKTTYSSLLCAVETCNLEIVEYLHLNFMCECPLFVFEYAVKYEYNSNSDGIYRIIEYLVDHKVCNNYKQINKTSNRVRNLMNNSINYSYEVQTVMDLCSFIDNSDISSMFIENGYIDSLIVWAIKNGRLDIIEHAHYTNVPINVSIIEQGCIYNQLDIVKFGHVMRMDYKHQDILEGKVICKKNGYNEILDYLENYL